VDNEQPDKSSVDLERPEQNLLGDLKLNTPIFRYMPINRFSDMITKKELALCKPGVWDDPAENFLEKMTVTRNGESVSFDLTKDFYAQCWTLKKKECDGFWRNYCSLSEGVRIETTVEKLIRAVWDDKDDYRVINYFVGKVDYMSDDKLKEKMKGCLQFGHSLTDTSGKGVVEAMLRKREEFEWETEVRVLAKDAAINSDFKFFAIDPVKFIDSIMFAPMANCVRFKAYKNCLGDRGFDRKFISRSKLYDPWALTLP